MKRKHKSIFVKNFAVSVFTLCLTNLIIFGLIFLIYPISYRNSIDKYYVDLTNQLIVELESIDSQVEVEQKFESYEHQSKLSAILVDSNKNIIGEVESAKVIGLDAITSVSKGYKTIKSENDGHPVQYLVINNVIEHNSEKYQLYTMAAVSSTRELFYPFVYMSPLIIVAVIIQALIIALIVSRYSLKPIKLLSKKAHAITFLDFENDYKWNSDDEYGELSTDLDIMQEKMEQVISRLEDDNYLNNQLVIDENKEQISILSHELNTPLTILRMQNELLLTQDLNEQTIDYIKRNLRKVDEIADLVDTILNYKALEVAEKVKVSDVVIAMLESKSIYKNVKFEIKNEITVNVAPIYLKRIISNLLTNAVKYNHQDQQIIVTLKGSDFIVRNNHSPELHFEKSLMRPYVRGDNSAEEVGQGLGLYICDRICTLNKFRFEVNAENQIFIARVKLDPLEID